MTVMAPALRVDDVRDQLLTLDSVRNTLAKSEPLGSFPFEVGTNIAFRVEDDWNTRLPEIEPMDTVNAYVRLGDNVSGAKEFQLTKESVLKAAAIPGWRQTFTAKSPAKLLQDHLNYYWRAGMDDDSFQMLTAGDTAVAFSKDTLVPFSNTRLLDQILEGIEMKYGVGEVLVDSKFFHSLTNTNLRLVIPEKRRNIEGTGLDDDTWSVGLELNNSLTGDGQTGLIGYLFRWWCTNGATTIHTGAQPFSRKLKHREKEVYKDVYEWARGEVDQILGGLEGELDGVQASVSEDLTGNYGAAAADVYRAYKIPPKHQSLITRRLVDDGNFTMYHLMQAITATANDSGLKPHEVSRLLRTGGSLYHRHVQPCNLGQVHLRD